MATFHPSIMGSDEAYDCEYQIVTACGINYRRYLLDNRILKKIEFEKNFEKIIHLLDLRNPVACQVLGVITLRTGSYFPEHYKNLAIKFSELKYDKTVWKNRINIRKIYLRDFREKVRNHIAGKKSHLIHLQINHDNELKFASIGFTHFIDLFNKKAFNRIKHINLDSCNLSSFPTNILSFQLLESLSLNNNSLINNLLKKIFFYG